MNILSSASRTVFVLMAIGLIGLTAFKVIEPKDFIMLASMTFSYYFTRDKGANPTA